MCYKTGAYVRNNPHQKTHVLKHTNMRKQHPNQRLPAIYSINKGNEQIRHPSHNKTTIDSKRIDNGWRTATGLDARAGAAVPDSAGHLTAARSAHRPCTPSRWAGEPSPPARLICHVTARGHSHLDHCSCCRHTPTHASPTALPLHCSLTIALLPRQRRARVLGPCQRVQQRVLLMTR